MRDLVERWCPELATLAARLTGADPFERAGDGTRYLQPAVFCASVASWIALGRPRPRHMAGHSLGEYAALVAAGSLSAEDALHVVVARGRAMQSAAEAARRPGGMVVVALGAVEARALAAPHGLTVANENGPDQVVLSGDRDAIDALRAEMRAARLRSKVLPVPGALHSPAMQPALPAVRDALAAVPVRRPRVTVLSGATAKPFADVRAELAAAIVRPVRWRELLIELRARGVDRFVEPGPGRVLSGLVRRTLPDAEATAGAAVLVAADD